MLHALLSWRVDVDAAIRASMSAPSPHPYKMSKNLQISSLNIRGLRSYHLHSQKLRYIRQLGSDIICLQETHAQPTDYELWHRQSLAVQSHWTPQVAIVSYSRSFHLHNMTTVTDRIITAELMPNPDISSAIDKILLVAIYAPPQLRERKLFFASLLSFPWF